MLSSQYAVNFVQGYQVAPEAPDTLLIGATCKHFVANSMERTTNAGMLVVVLVRNPWHRFVRHTYYVLNERATFKLQPATC